MQRKKERRERAPRNVVYTLKSPALFMHVELTHSQHLHDMEVMEKFPHDRHFKEELHKQPTV